MKSHQVKMGCLRMLEDVVTLKRGMVMTLLVRNERFGWGDESFHGGDDVTGDSHAI